MVRWTRRETENRASAAMCPVQAVKNAVFDEIEQFLNASMNHGATEKGYFVPGWSSMANLSMLFIFWSFIYTIY